MKDVINIEILGSRIKFTEADIEHFVEELNQSQQPALSQSEAQDEMLRQATMAGKPALWDRFNQIIWPDCNMCAGWRGFVAGLILATITITAIHYL